MPTYDITSVVTDYQTGGTKAARPLQPSAIEKKWKDASGKDMENIPGSATWYKNQAEWLWWMYANNYTDINYSTRLEIINLRLYAAGRQPIEKYLNPWRRWDEKANRWITWANISFDIYAVIPKLVSAVRGILSKVDFTVQAHCVDENAGAEREEMIAKQEVLEKDKEFYAAAHKVMGTESEQQQSAQPLPFIPQNKEQAQMLVDMGFIKITSEAELEELLKQSADDGRWNETIKPRLETDGFTIGKMWTRAMTDPVTKRIMPRYVDPENLVVRYHAMDDYYQKISYVGEIVPYTIGDLRARGVKDQELLQCVKYYASKVGNPALNAVGQNVSNTYYNPVWNDWTVYVLEMEFESMDFQKHEWVEFDQTTGKYIPSSKDKYGAFPRELQDGTIGDHTAMTQYPKWHRVDWIIGTNTVLNEGFQFDTPYTQEDRPQSTFSGCKVSDRSPVSIIIPDADAIQNLELKRRAAVAKMRPGGIIIDKNAWQETEVGGKKFTWLDQLNMFNQTGDAVIQNPVTPTGQAIPGVPLPFYDNKGTIGVLVDYDSSIDRAVARMSDKIGIPMPAEGSSVDPNAPVKTTQLAIEGMNNTLRPILMAYQSVKKQTFSKMAYMYEIRSKAALLKEYEGIIGHDGVDLLKFVNQFHHGISVDVFTDDDTKNDLIASMKLSLQAAKTGGVGITDADYFAAKRLVDQGLYKSAELFLNWRDGIRKQEALQMQSENMKENRITMQTQEQMKQQALALKEQSQRETKLLVENAKLEGQVALLMTAFNNDRKLLADTSTMTREEKVLEGTIDEELIGVQADADIKVAKAAPKLKPTAKK